MTKKYHHGALREALLDAALEVVENSGAENLSLRDLARSLSVSPTASYRHFADKDALLTAVAARGYDEFATALERSAAEDTSESHGLLGMGRAYMEFALTRPNLYKLMFTYPLTGTGPEEEARYNASLRPKVILDEAIAWHLDKLGRSDEAKVAAAIAGWSGVHGLALLLMDGRIDLEEAGLEQDELIARVIEVVITGLVTHPEFR